MGCVLLVFVSQTVPPALSDRFALIIEGLCQAVARRVGLGGLAGPFIILIWSRLRRLATRFACHAVAPLSSQAAPEAVIARAAKQSKRRPRSASQPLPRHRAWLLRLVPEAASGASQLRHFLADPEVASLLAQAPQLRRILRPLCHMLGIRAAQALPPLSQSLSHLPAQPPDVPANPCHAPPQLAAPRPAAPIALPPWPPLPPPDALPRALA